MNCSNCETTKDVKEYKHLPLPNGRNGHITLSSWTKYCPNCVRQESEKLNDLINSKRG